jgi:hypothetical protein
MLVNLVLGSVLWTTYSEVTRLLEPHMDSQVPVAAAAGAVAGGAQAVVAAPAENVRFVLEGGTPATGWSHAWKEVFRGTRGDGTLSKRDELHQAREVRDWMREVGDMAGRGWNGWGWGVAKDACGMKFVMSKRSKICLSLLRFRCLLHSVRDDTSSCRNDKEVLKIVHRG